MNRREMLAATAGAVLPLPLAPAGAVAARTLPVLKADEPSRNGLIVPADVILRALPTLGECPVCVGEPRPEIDDRGCVVSRPVVGRATGWGFAGGWLTATVRIDEPDILTGFELLGPVVLRPSVSAHWTNDDKEEPPPHRMTELLNISVLYFESPTAQSWVAGTCPTCGGDEVAAQWFKGGAVFVCRACGGRRTSTKESA